MVAPAPAVDPTSTNIVNKISTFIKRFVFLKEEPRYLLLALWVIHTYLIDEFEFTGYVLAHSPEPESGKSRLLEVLEMLVENTSGILISPSLSVLFRTAKGHTQFLDEIDTWTNRDELRGVLNAGYQQGGQIPRMKEKASKHKDYEVENFLVFAPRALSGIGLHTLPEATRTRTFGFPMVRQTVTERREKLRKRRVKPEAQSLVNEIKAWVVQHRSPVAVRYAEEFPYLDHFRDRTSDISEPLAAILEVTYANDTEFPKIRKDFIRAVALSRGEQVDDESLDRGILRALVQSSEVNQFLRPTDSDVVGSASELAALCSNSGIECSEYDVSRVLRNYGFVAKSVRLDGEPRKRYVLSSEALRDLSERYLSSREARSAGNDAEVATSQVDESSLVRAV